MTPVETSGTASNGLHAHTSSILLLGILGYPNLSVVRVQSGLQVIPVVLRPHTKKYFDPSHPKPSNLGEEHCSMEDINIRELEKELVDGNFGDVVFGHVQPRLQLLRTS